MADHDDMPSWYREWRSALELVIATGVTRDRAKRGTPEREAADRVHEERIRFDGRSQKVDQSAQ
jgi:hypothetical protein